MVNELVKYSDVYALNTAREVLNYVKNRLLAQGKPSENQVNGTCKYRMPTDSEKQLACGIGMVIPDAEYDERLDSPGMSVVTMLNMARYNGTTEPLPLDNFPVSEEFLHLVHRVQASEKWTEQTTVDFFSQLQMLHDRAAGLSGAKFGYRLARGEEELVEWLETNSPSPFSDSEEF